MLLPIDVGNTQTVIGLYDLEPDDAHNVGRRLADTHLLDHWRGAAHPGGGAPAQGGVLPGALRGRRLADPHWLDHWRVATNAERTADEQALVIQEFLGFHGFSFDDDIAGIVLCSSVPRVTGALRRLSERYFGKPAIVVEPRISTGLP